MMKTGPWMLKARTLFQAFPTVTIYENEIRSVSENVTVIINAIKVALENTPPELASDIVDRGIVLAREALLRGLDELLKHETGLPVSLPKTRLPQSREALERSSMTWIF
jgi:rod shape-determining protein MreB